MFLVAGDMTRSLIAPPLFGFEIYYIPFYKIFNEYLLCYFLMYSPKVKAVCKKVGHFTPSFGI